VNGLRAVVIDVTRFQHLAPEEIAGALLLVIAIAVAVMIPGPISELFESPYSTPAPGGGPARQIVPGPTGSPASGVVGDRVIGLGPPGLPQR
jgi:hypothetical protein